MNHPFRTMNETYLDNGTMRFCPGELGISFITDVANFLRLDDAGALKKGNDNTVLMDKNTEGFP